MVEQLFLRYFDVGAYGVVGGAILLLFCLLLTALRAPAWTAALGAGLLMLRMLVPAAIPAPVSLFNSETIDGAVPHAADFARSYWGDDQIALDIPGGGGEFGRVTAAGVPALDPEEWSTDPDKFDFRAAFYTEDENGNIAPAETQLQALVPLLSRIWLGGVGVMLAYGVISWLRLKRRLRFAVPDGDAWICDGLVQPCVAGFLRPRIYLPPGLSEAQRRHIVCHERQHIRRRDHILKALSWLAVCLHWYHPWVWAFHSVLAGLIEEACDDSAVATLGEDERAGYAESLLALSSKKRALSPSPLAFSENDTKGRIKRILRRRRPRPLFSALCLILTAAALCACMTQPAAASPRGGPVEVSFPAYRDGAENYPDSAAEFVNAALDFEPFTLSLDLPDGWTAALPPEDARALDAFTLCYGCPLLTPVYIYDENGGYAGFIGWYMLEDDALGASGSGVSDEEFRNMAYFRLRVGAHYFWQDFEQISRTGTSETCTAQVYYQDPIESLPAASWPQHYVPGICCYDTGIGAYACVQFDAGAIGSDELRTVAASMELRRS